MTTTDVPNLAHQGAAGRVAGLLHRPRKTLATNLAVWGAVLALGIFLPWVLGLYPLQLAVQGATLGILALSIGWLRRQTGLLTFGHAAFYGVAGYATAIAANNLGLGTLGSLSFGLAFGTALSFLIALFLMRAKGIAFAQMTLAVGMLLWVAITQNREITNGFDGLPIRFDGSLLGLRPSQFANPVNAWPIIWVLLLLMIGFLWWLSSTEFGRHLVAIRESPERTLFTGRAVYLPKVLAFTVSGFVASLAGVVNALNVGYVSPENLFWAMSGLALIVAIIGGVGSVWGPPLGALAFVYLQAALSTSPYYQLILGGILIFMVIFVPGGGADIVSRVWKRIRSRNKEVSRA